MRLNKDQIHLGLVSIKQIRNKNTLHQVTSTQSNYELEFHKQKDRRFYHPQLQDLEHILHRMYEQHLNRTYLKDLVFPLLAKNNNQLHNSNQGLVLTIQNYRNKHLCSVLEANMMVMQMIKNLDQENINYEKNLMHLP